MGACALLTPPVYAGGPDDTHPYYAFADVFDVVYESNEDDNRGELD